MAKIIKNIDSVQNVWGGMAINAGSTYTCNDQLEANKFANDNNFITALTQNKAEVYNDSSKLNSIALALNFLGEKVFDSSGNMIVKATAFANNENFRFRGCSFSGLALANSDTNIDFKLTAERYMNGGKLILEGSSIDDKICFQVVDIDNVLGYGANAVLDEFIKDFYLPLNAPLEVDLPYTARLYANLYLRLVYKNSGNSDVKVKCNLYLHWKQS
jgi:hypothetical protein